MARGGGARIVGYALSAALAIGIGGLGYVLATRDSGGDGSAGGASIPASASGAASPAGTTSGADPATSEPTPADATSQDTATADPTSSTRAPTLTAQERGLDELRSARETSLEGLLLDGRWALRLSSKSNGISDARQYAGDGSHVFHYDDIAAQYARLRADVIESRGWPSLTLLASDYGPYHAGNNRFWNLLADPGGITSAAEGEAVCAGIFPQLSGDALDDVCIPTQLRPGT
ncbi:MAG: hypothetical protein U0Q21_11020 [Dermatophilaceae bacterium]